MFHINYVNYFLTTNKFGKSILVIYYNRFTTF